jgi:hypothetical protein
MVCRTAHDRVDRGLFPPEQQHSLVALATQVPQEEGHPITQWSMTDLCRAAVEKGIVGSIRAATIWRLLDHKTMQFEKVKVIPPTKESQTILKRRITDFNSKDYLFSP